MMGARFGASAFATANSTTTMPKRVSTTKGIISVHPMACSLPEQDTKAHSGIRLDIGDSGDVDDFTMQRHGAVLSMPSLAVRWTNLFWHLFA
jgi:hypothetical protein